MKTMLQIMTQFAAIALAGAALSSCAKLSDALDSSSAITLREMTASDSSDSSSDDTSTGGSCQANGTPSPLPAPTLDACTSDLATYCADVTVPTDGTGDWRPVVDCLKKNLSSLADACKTQVNAVPKPPPHPPRGGGHGGPGGPGGPGGHQGRHQGPPPSGEAGSCGGSRSDYAFLGPCNDDATKYCSASLPTHAAFEKLSLSGKLEALLAVIDCLNTNSDSVSTACQAVLTSEE